MKGKKRKIAVVVPKYGTIGGAEGYVSEVTERIALDPRFEIHVFAHRWEAPSGRVTFHRVPVISFPKFLTTPSFACFAHRAMSGIHFDLIHAHDRIFQADVFSMHGIPHRLWVREVRRKRWMSLFDRATARVERALVESGRCRYFLPVSELTRIKFLEEYPVDPAKVKVIHPGIDPDAYASPDRESCRKEIRCRFGLAPESVLILFVSMNFEVKGLDFLMAGLSRLKKIHPRADFRLLVVGKGDEEKYARLARDLGIGEEITFAGVVPYRELASVYLASDVYAMISRFDTFGMVVLEAMAASLPVVIGGNVGAKDIVREGENGFVVEGTDAGGIADKMNLLLSDEKRIDMGRKALETARNHSWDRVAEETISVYDSVLQGITITNGREKALYGH